MCRQSAMNSNADSHQLREPTGELGVTYSGLPIFSVQKIYRFVVLLKSRRRHNKPQRVKACRRAQNKRTGKTPPRRGSPLLLCRWSTASRFEGPTNASPQARKKRTSDCPKHDAHHHQPWNISNSYTNPQNTTHYVLNMPISAID